MPEAVSRLRDVRPPLALPAHIAWWALAVILTTALIAALIYFLYKKYSRRSGDRDETPQPPPWETAMQRLRELKAEDLPAQGKVQEYFTRLSGILRLYIEDSFSIRAPEMTSEEFLGSLRDSLVLNASQKQAVGRFLTGCDLVKFARYRSSPAQMEEGFQLVQRLIDETRPVAVQPAPKS